MTEAEWLACAEPEQMVAYLEGRTSTRRLLLLSCACSRRHWRLLETTTLREAVDTCEGFADGEIDEEVFQASARSTHPLMNYREEILSGQHREDILWAAYAINAAMWNFRGCGHSKAIKFYALAARSSGEERAAHIHLIRDIFGNPSCPSPPIPSAVLAWNDGTIRCLAEAIYQEREMPEAKLDNVRLAILADALLDAGCEYEDLIQHCREPGRHVRGCWAVDLILGKS